MTVYAIATLNIHDRERYAQYEAGFMDIFSAHKGAILAVDEAPQVIEGNWPFTRTVLLSFPSRDDLDAWYQSEAYQDILQHRLAASTGNVVIIDALAVP